MKKRTKNYGRKGGYLEPPAGSALCRATNIALERQLTNIEFNQATDGERLAGDVKTWSKDEARMYVELGLIQAEWHGWMGV